jgi:uncharacterized damage-inducible protein DinB
MEIRKDLLEPIAGYSHELGYYLGSMEKSRAYTRKVVEDLTPAELAQRFLPELHSIGAITLHLGEAEFYWIQEVVGQRTPTEEEKKFTHQMDTMENDVDRGFTAEYCLGTIDKISLMTRDLLKNFTDKDLENIYLREYNDIKTEITLRSVLWRLIDHEGHHRGQISMIKRLIRGGEASS